MCSPLIAGGGLETLDILHFMRGKDYFWRLRDLFLAVTLGVAAVSAGYAQIRLPEPVFLYQGSAPGSLGNDEADRPRFYPFMPAKRSTSAAVLVIPGGGYEHVVIGHEGFQIAAWLNAQGMPAFVLDYRVKPYRYPVEIDDGRRAMRIIRAHAAEYGVDPNRIGVWGSSAGGHLASSLGTHCENGTTTVTNAEASNTNSANASAANANAGITNADAADAVSCKPNFMVLEYPVISMIAPEAHHGSALNLLGPDPDPKLVHDYSNQNAVTADTPPTFLFATIHDPTVPVENTLDFYNALVKAHVSAEMHIYDYADHGCGLCGSIIPLATWPALVRNWFIQHSYLPPDAPPEPTPMPNIPGFPPGVKGPGIPAQ
jgi:acetyl esterase/lipase